MGCTLLLRTNHHLHHNRLPSHQLFYREPEHNRWQNRFFGTVGNLSFTLIQSFILITSYHRKRHPMRHRHIFRQSLAYLIPELTVCVTAQKVRCWRDSLQHFSIFITPRCLGRKQQKVRSLSWRFACWIPECVSHARSPFSLHSWGSSSNVYDDFLCGICYTRIL